MSLNQALDRFAGVLDRRPLVVALSLFIVAASAYGFRLGLPDIYGDDEALDAGVVWEMAENDHWLLPFFNDEMVPEKPPLFFWLAAGVARIGGVSETTVRLPSVVAAALTVMTVFLAGRRLVGAGPAFLAALIVLTAPMMVARARVGRADMVLVACATGAFFAAAISLAPNAARRHRNAFWLLAALAVLAKAGAGLGVVACGTVALLLGARKGPLRLATPEGIIGFVVLAFSWHVFATLALGQSFVSVNLLQQNLNHLVGGIDGPPVKRGIEHLLKPTINLIGGVMPWSILGLVAVRGWRTAWSTNGKLGLIWAGAGLAFFSAAASRHSYYVAPLVPPLALFLGTLLWNEKSAQPRAPVVRIALVSLSIAVIVAIVGVVLLRAWSAADWVGMSVSDHTRAAMLWEWWSRRSALAVVLLAVLAAASIFSVRMTWRRQAAWAVAVCLLAAAGIQAITEAALGSESTAHLSLKSFAGEVARVDGPVYFYGPVIRQIVYHARRHIHHASLAELSARSSFYLIATESELLELRTRLVQPVAELAAGDGIVNNSDVAHVVLLRVDR
ncbi:MAG: glycosyltransferase family 39 protein [Deltaproteobacteria bacterium]|nr:glycosyltransferase family 39 protein [Deltaproteobacteria bacterium]MBI3386676.1 glycosyltransferase family 39 protein [Deltaproteobacteria bacterium]